jgi:hypothetical protein
MKAAEGAFSEEKYRLLAEALQQGQGAKVCGQRLRRGRGGVLLGCLGANAKRAAAAAETVTAAILARPS